MRGCGQACGIGVPAQPPVGDLTGGPVQLWQGEALDRRCDVLVDESPRSL
jgi:hypothetical protein